MTGKSPVLIRPAFVRCLLVLGVAFLLFEVISVNIDQRERRPSKVEAKVTVWGLRAALKGNYGSLPPAEHLMAALRGRNPRGIVFFDAEAKSFNARQEFIDPWGTPYRFDLPKPEAIRVWSFGPNRQDESGAEGSDDIVSWR